MPPRSLESRQTENPSPRYTSLTLLMSPPRHARALYNPKVSPEYTIRNPTSYPFHQGRTAAPAAEITIKLPIYSVGSRSSTSTSHVSGAINSINKRANDSSTGPVLCTVHRLWFTFQLHRPAAAEVRRQSRGGEQSVAISYFFEPCCIYEDLPPHSP